MKTLHGISKSKYIQIPRQIFHRHFGNLITYSIGMGGPFFSWWVFFNNSWSVCQYLPAFKSVNWSFCQLVGFSISTLLHHYVSQFDWHVLIRVSPFVSMCLLHSQSFCFLAVSKFVSLPIRQLVKLLVISSVA